MMIEAVRRLFASMFEGVPDLVACAPGRVNLIGEHTDYNDGFVLPCTIGRKTYVAARARRDGQVNLVAGDLANARTGFSLEGPILPDDAAPWSNYIRGMASLLRDNGVRTTGADLAIVGDMPQGAGLSSSAALEIASGLAFAALAGRADIDRTMLAKLGQTCEHQFAGCQCGIMDQLVIARAEEGAALLIDCRSLELRTARVPDDVAVMIVHSGIERGLVDGAYNERRRQCEEAAAYFGFSRLRDVTGDDLATATALDPVTRRRARHVITENARTLNAADALSRADLETLGALMAQSHISMRDDFEITLPAIDGLVAHLQSAIGKQGGARMTGGGFGGAVVALMPQNRVDLVRETILKAYKTPSNDPPLILVERPGSAAHIIA
jgi:galactokinase